MTEISFPPPAKLLSLNDRMHWRPKADLNREWRVWTKFFALQQLPQPYGYGSLRHAPSTVHVSLPVRDSRRRDPHNYIATVKPIIDGLVDAGLWPDDTAEWVATTEPVLVPKGTLVVVKLVAR